MPLLLDKGFYTDLLVRWNVLAAKVIWSTDIRSWGWLSCLLLWEISNEVLLSCSISLPCLAYSFWYIIGGGGFLISETFAGCQSCRCSCSYIHLLLNAAMSAVTARIWSTPYSRTRAHHGTAPCNVTGWAYSSIIGLHLDNATARAHRADVTRGEALRLGPWWDRNGGPTWNVHHIIVAWDYCCIHILSYGLLRLFLYGLGGAQRFGRHQGEVPELDGCIALCIVT